MTQIRSDSELLQACREGERDAFRRVVERYQGLITSITYNATGDIPVSEDLAQDTFLQAWRKIGSLKEPEKLAAWLCTIARNRVRDWIRRKRTDIQHNATLLTKETVMNMDESTPDKHLEREDESALVWRAIESIPEDYREVLILHYREEADAGQIAQILGVRENTVRQRLSRARALVRREMTLMVERGLRNTKPGSAFTLAVMAALPAITPKVATAAVGSGVVVKSSGSLLSLSMLIGPIIGIFGGLFGTWVGIKNTETPKERRFMIRYSVVLWVVVLLFMASLAIVSWWLRPMLAPGTFVLVESVMFLLYAACLAPITMWGNRIQRKIREQAGSPSLSESMRSNRATPAMIIGGLGGAIIGSFAWMVVMALNAGDIAVAITVASAGIGLFFAAAAYISKRGPDSHSAALYTVTWLIAIITAVVVNLRLHAWLAQLTNRPIADVKADLPTWSMNSLLISVFILVLTSIRFSTMQRSRRSSNQGE